MDQAPVPETEPANIRFLRVLVTALTLTMILGLLAIVWLLFTRLQPPVQAVSVPDQITLPAGVTATAFTRGGDWYAVVTDANTILIFDAASGDLRQTVEITP